MHIVRLPSVGTATAWRDAARRCLGKEIPPEDILWLPADGDTDLFATGDAVPGGPARFRVAREFVGLAESAVWHNDPERFALLYAFLWRLVDQPGLISDHGDAALVRLRAMAKGVRRCQHKMKAFVRFREIGAPDDPRRSFAAWFEPTHHTVEPTAPFFVKRFSDMDWRIVTPDRTAIFVDGKLTFSEGQSKPPLADDATEDLWSTYFRNIFNPARVKPKAMQAEMPKKYWRNLPEARHIPSLLADAEARAEAMREAAPTLPPPRAARILDRADPQRTRASDEPVETLDELRERLAGCQRCSLHCAATQAVPGEGPPDARMMIVGEQPGDAEDLEGRPFVGPAGVVFSKACAAAGIDRAGVYVTNAVKHFKFTLRGKKRLHQRPNAGEIEHCRWWLDWERKLLRPHLIVALGATAAQALTGRGKDILNRRGKVEECADGTPVFLTVHPSFILRLRDSNQRRDEITAFEDDLRSAKTLLARNAA